MVAKKLRHLFQIRNKALKCAFEGQGEATSDIVLTQEEMPQSGLDARCRNGISF